MMAQAKRMNSKLYMHMTPVMFGDTNSAGLRVSDNPAITKPQFAMGPQKCVVRTPVGEFKIAWALAARLLACFVAHMPAVNGK